ncbi:unnamed protein product [Taenia asiatica]|uniref:Uncharacterized protein n=1 Tax=Taenia asiatica TaxID=60517 RepID=A0A0R3WAN7_TAEAS|nr:unnamed protein product [Taenia asiatica]
MSFVCASTKISVQKEEEEDQLTIRLHPLIRLSVSESFFSLTRITTNVHPNTPFVPPMDFCFIMLALLTVQPAIAWSFPPLLTSLGTCVYTATALHYPLARVPVCHQWMPVINATGPVSPFCPLSLRVTPISNSPC